MAWARFMLRQFRNHRRRDTHHPVFAALGPQDEQRPFLELNVFDAQIERLTHPQPAAVKQADDQVGGITRPVPDGLEQGLGFRDGGGMAQAGRAPGAEGINVFVDKRSGVSIYDPAMNDFRTVALSIKGLHLSGLGIKLVQ